MMVFASVLACVVYGGVCKIVGRVHVFVCVAGVGVL